MDSTMTTVPVAATGAINPAKVRVAVRMRPLIDREKTEGCVRHWDCESFTVQQVDPKTGRHLPNCLPHPFDHVFGSHIKTEDLYEKVVAPIVEEAFNGFNGTVLCYGQTSSGKTYTLYGDENQPGIISLTANHLFKRINQDDTRQYFIRVGLLEIYNEKVTDLLNSENPIDIKEHNGQVYPKDLEEIQIVDAEGMLKAAQRVQRERKIGETRMNKESSRSHTILRISLESIKKDDLTGEEMPNISNAVLNFVDLAGSEKVHQTGATGVRLKEAAAINTSLFTLSQVVMQLSEESTDETRRNVPNANTTLGSVTASSKKPHRHIKFRDSKLTRILQNSLGGNAYIAMICNITPAYLEDTLSTLRFAKAAKKMQTRPQRNKLPVDKSEYEKVIGDLRSQLSGKSVEVQALRKQLAVMSRFCKPNQDPLSIVALQQVDRRKTLCPSQLLYNVKRCDTLAIRDNTLDVKTTLSNSVLKRVSEIALHSEHKDSFSPASSERFMTHSETLDHFRELTQSRLMSIDDNLALTDPDATKPKVKTKNEVSCRDVDVQTTFDENQSPPAKKSRFSKPLADDTPKTTISLARSLLAQKIEDDNLEWKTQKEFLEDELTLKGQLLDQTEQKASETNEKMEKSQAELKKFKELLSSKDYEVDILFQQNQQKTKLIEQLRSQLQEISVAQEANNFDSLDLTIGDQSVLAMETEVKELREALQLLRSEIELRDTEIEDIKLEKSSTQEKNEQEIAKLKQQLTENLKLPTEVDKMRKDMIEKTMEIVTLQSELKLKESKLLAAEIEKDGYSNKISILTQQLEETEENFKVIKSELNVKQYEFSNIEREKANVEAKDEEITQLKEEIQAKLHLETELEKLRNDINEKSAEINALQSELRLKDSDLTVAMVEKDDSSSKISILTKKLEDTEKNVSIIKSELNVKQNEFSHLEKEKESVEATKDEEIAKLREEIQAKISVETELENARDDIKEKATEIATLQSELQSKHSELTVAMMEKGDSSSKILLLTKEFEDTKEKLNVIQAELTVKQNEFSTVEKEQASVEAKDQEIAKLREEIQAKISLETELEKARDDIKEKATEIITLQSELRSKHSELSGAMMERDDSSSKLLILTKQLEDTEEKLNIIKSELNAKQDEFSNIEKDKDSVEATKDQEITKLREEIHAKINLETELEKLRDDMKEKATEIDTLQSELRSKHSELTEAMMEKGNSSSKILVLTKELEDTKEKLSFTKEELTVKQNEFSHLEKEKESVEATKDEEIAKLREEIQAKISLETELENLRDDINIKATEIDTLQSQLRSKHSELTEAMMEKGDSSSQILILTKQLEDTEEKLNIIKSELNVKQNEFCNVEKEKDSVEATKEQEITKLREEIKAKISLETEVEKLKKDINKKGIEIDTLQSELTVAMMEKGDSASKILLLTKELEDTKEKLNIIKAELNVTQNEFSNVQKEKEHVEATKDQEITKLREEIRAKISIETEVEKLREDIKEKATEIDTLQSQLRSKHSELTVAMLEWNDSSSKIALLTKQLEEEQENLKAIKLEIATIKDSKLSEHQKIKKLEKEIKELQELLQLFRSEVEVKNKEIEAVKSEKNTVLEEKQKEILDKMNLKSELDKFRLHVNEKSKEIISLQSKLKWFDSEMATALEEKDKSSIQIMQMTRQLQEAQDNMQTIQSELTTKNTKLSNVLKEKDNKILVMIQQLEELQDLKNSSNTHTRSVLVNRETQTGASIDVMGHLKNYKVRCKILQKDREESVRVQNEQKTQIMNLEINNKNYVNECDKLKNSLCFLQQEHDAKKKANFIDAEIQCNYLAELVVRSNKGESGLMPDGFPDIVEIKKENSRLRSQICNLEKGKFKCTCKMWETLKKPAQNTQQTALPEVGQTQPICFPQSGTFDYKECLAKLKSKASQPPSYPPRKYNLRSGRNPPPEHNAKDEKVVVPLSASVGASNSTPSATTTTNSNQEAIDPSAWANKLKEMMKDTWSDDI